MHDFFPAGMCSPNSPVPWSVTAMTSNTYLRLPFALSGRGIERKNKTVGGSNSQKVFPNIDGLAQEINNGELSGW